MIHKKTCELANLEADFNERIPSLEFEIQELKEDLNRERSKRNEADALISRFKKEVHDLEKSLKKSEKVGVKNERTATMLRKEIKQLEQAAT
jgi:chromosome segregation ATPase